MSRHFDDWLKAYVAYASFSEAPPHMHFWAGVSAVAGALRRKVWVEMGYFRWHANHYIILVAPPGVVSKSTTSAIAINILRKVKGIKFGPDVVTWPALVSAFAASGESFIYNGEYHAQCALTLESSEFGNLINPQDREQIDLLVTLWDSKQGAFRKVTKGSGVDEVENPWINMIACTTPSWIAGNFPEYIIGGGFTSRCLFVYADTKDKYVAYPSRQMPKDIPAIQQKLLEDLDYIANNFVGPFTITEDAIEWGEAWYERHHRNPPAALNDDRFGGYLARKQTHLHKLAMVLSVSCRDSMVITRDDLVVACKMISDLEPNMQKVFHKIGRNEQSIQAERFVKFVLTNGPVTYADAYKYVYTAFPNTRDFEGIVHGAVNSGQIQLTMAVGGFMLSAPTKRIIS